MFNYQLKSSVKNSKKISYPAKLVKEFPFDPRMVIANCVVADYPSKFFRLVEKIREDIIGDELAFIFQDENKDYWWVSNAIRSKQGKVQDDLDRLNQQFPGIREICYHGFLKSELEKIEEEMKLEQSSDFMRLETDLILAISQALKEPETLRLLSKNPVLKRFAQAILEQSSEQSSEQS